MAPPSPRYTFVGAGESLDPAPTNVFSKLLWKFVYAKKIVKYIKKTWNFSHRNIMTYGYREKYERHKLTLLLFKSVQNAKLVLSGMR